MYLLIRSIVCGLRKSIVKLLITIKKGYPRVKLPLDNLFYALFFIILIVCHNLWTSYLILQAQTFLDFYVHTIAQAGGYLLAGIGFLLAAALYDIYKGAVAAELDGTLGHGDHVARLCQYYLSIGAVAGTDLAALY